MFPYVPYLIPGIADSQFTLERDSPRDQLVVTLFLLTVFGLLLGAGIKNRMLRAGLTGELPWNRRNQGRWWEVSRIHC